MLIAFPLALLPCSLICDLLAFAYPRNPHWPAAALYAMVGGVIGALVAAIPGVIDMLALSDAKVRRIALAHMFVNLSVVAVFGADAALRLSGNGGTLPVVLSVVGLALLGVSGWLGGEMVYVHGVAVHPLVDSPAEMRAKDRVHGSARPAR